MNIIDSSFWLEFYKNKKYSKVFFTICSDLDRLIVPSITIFEVFKILCREYSEKLALEYIAYMKTGKLIFLDDELALNAAYYSNSLKLPLADSIIYATAMKHDATIYTLDQHFKGLKNVNYFEK